MKSRQIQLIICVIMIAVSGCRKGGTVSAGPGTSAFSDNKITITYNEKKYDVILNSDGTVSGDAIVFIMIRYHPESYSYTERESREPYEAKFISFCKWRDHERGKSVIIEAEHRIKYLYFFKDALLVYDGDGLVKLDYQSPFADKLPAVVMEDIFSDEEVAYYKSQPYIRYIKPAEGAELSKTSAADSETIDHMEEGDKFFILETEEEQAVDNKKGRRVYGCWRGIRGWTFDSYLTGRKFEVKRTGAHPYYSRFKQGKFPNFRTVVYELPDKSSRVIKNTIDTLSYYFFTGENGDPGWIYIQNNLISGYVEKGNIEDESTMDFQDVSNFKKLKYEGESSGYRNKYTFNTDGSCVLEGSSEESDFSYKEEYQLYRYKDIYCLRGGNGNSVHSYFRFKDYIPCGLEYSDEINSKAKCEKE